ncbi:MAG: hypothetical protein U1A06_04590 [Hoeflea sp.]|uniref:hypothetical protein n=1 Tax=Hoeflea sp. TaxID=1940281 RepID=UPI0027305BEE|nr:hypothetical protein [Hoeflea sp.]MDP2121372.1 hypothetical protein [Hoeflea sp.]MDZ7600634.1 hypothetical protein [Hoeflea sp.]
MRKVLTSHPDSDAASVESFQASHPLALSSEHPLTTSALVDVNDKSWNHLYGAMIDGLGISPKNFQLIYPFTTWDWPVVPVGYTGAAQWDFCSTVPQFSATGEYTSAGTAFNDAYGQMLNVVSAATSDPKLKADIEQARNMLQLAVNNYDTIYRQATDAYHSETGGSNTPPFTEWLGTFGGRSWRAQLESADKNVQAQQDVYNQLLSEVTTPGLKDAQDRLRNQDYYTKLQDPALASFPAVPGYSLGMDATTWLNKVKAGTGGSSGSIGFANSQSEYDYKKTWAGGSASINKFFWSVNVGGSWERIDEFASDSSLKVDVSFKAWDQISIQASRWYNGAFVTGIQSGPFIRGYSPYGDSSTKAVWGPSGIMSVQKVGMLVCYKPSFSITVSDSTFKSFSEKWSVSAGLRIGPFSFSGGGGSSSSGWKADSATKTFTGESTAETALIMGANINLINPQ